jgi:hypothetical protein
MVGVLIAVQAGCGGSGSAPAPTGGSKSGGRVQPGQAREVSTGNAYPGSGFTLAQAGWTTETAAAVGAGWVSWTSSIAVSNSVYIAYYDGVLKDLMLATKTGGAWSSQTLDAPFDNGRYNSMVLNSSGTPQISYHRLGGSLRFSEGSTLTVVDGTPDSGSFNDIAGDPSEDLHISYAAIVSPNRLSRLSQLRYARRSGSVWTTEVVDSGPANSTTTIAFTSIALLPGNIPAIAYRGLANNIRYAVRNGASWVIQDVPGTSNPSGISLVVDGSGTPHILWSNAGAQGALWHTWNAGGAWLTEQVGAYAAVGTPNAALIASDGFLYVAAYEWNGTKDLVLFRQTLAGWVKESLDTSGDTGKNAAITTDPEGCLHISHFNDTTDRVLHTYQTANCPGGPQSFTLTITVVGNGTVTAPGIACPADCSETYPASTVVTLVATPGGGWQFEGWTGDPDCADGSVTMNANKACTATFSEIPPPPPQSGKPFLLIGGQSDANLISIFNSSAILTSPPDSDFVPVPKSSGVILVGDYVLIGINPLGNLDTPAEFGDPLILGWTGPNTGGPVPLPPMFDPQDGRGYPNGSAGFAFRENPSLPFEQDVISPGRLCEGWGVRFSDGKVDWDGGASVDCQTLTDAVLVFFGTVYDPVQQAWFVRSRAMVGKMEKMEKMEITMDYSLRKTDKYVAERIVLRNTSATNTLSDIRFARTLDYDVGPGHFTDSSQFLFPGVVPQIIRIRDTTSIDPFWDGPREPNDNFYGVATGSPFTTCANGITFANNDPDYLLHADENKNGIPDCNEDPAGALGDLSSSFVFQVSSIPPLSEVAL